MASMLPLRQYVLTPRLLQVELQPEALESVSHSVSHGVMACRQSVSQLGESPAVTTKTRDGEREVSHSKGNKHGDILTVACRYACHNSEVTWSQAYQRLVIRRISVQGGGGLTCCRQSAAVPRDARRRTLRGRQ